jgi:hypothetical protein
VPLQVARCFGLVCISRALMHPITERQQVSHRSPIDFYLGKHRILVIYTTANRVR